MKNNEAINKATMYVLFICMLTFGGCAASGPPVEKGEFRNSDLVELTRLDSTLKLDIKYATNNNFVNRPVYKEARAFLQQPAAKELVAVNKELKELGYGLLIFDGYRPWAITKLFWDITSKENKKFVADPKKGSMHNRGCAVDLSLYDLASGKEIQMLGAYDEMSERSYPSYTGGTIEERAMRDLLRTKMEAHGFKVYQYEWWHFDYKDWKLYRVQDIAFSEIHQ